MVGKRSRQKSPLGPLTNSIGALTQPTPSTAKRLFSFKIPNVKPPVHQKKVLTKGMDMKGEGRHVKVKLEAPDDVERPLLESVTKKKVLEHAEVDLRAPGYADIKQEVPDQLEIKQEISDHLEAKQEVLEHLYDRYEDSESFESFDIKLEIPAECQENKLPTLIYDLINVFLSKKNYNITTMVEDKSCVVIRALKYVMETLFEIPESNIEGPLTLTTAKNTVDEICDQISIPTDERTVYCCIFCNWYDDGLGFEELFDHIEAQHHHERQWHGSWRLASWPKILPIRYAATILHRDEWFKIVTDNMRDIVWKMNEFRMTHIYQRLALWFRLSLDWYIKFDGFKEPHCESFFQCALFVQRDTEHSIFKAIQCGLCGSSSSNYGTRQWNIYELRRHFKYAHARDEEFGIWMYKMIGIPPDLNLSSFGEEITDDGTRKQWLELWKLSGEGLEILEGLRKARGVRLADEYTVSVMPFDGYDEKHILWHPDDMLTRCEEL
ncbi:hypothetical protein DFP73DRAFT_605270 [Morchella snyderi]|nr:hypothetical protein DFP73DRAFT_605270 [Morchella snyderi]